MTTTTLEAERKAFAEWVAAGGLDYLSRDNPEAWAGWLAQWISRAHPAEISEPEAALSVNVPVPAAWVEDYVLAALLSDKHACGTVVSGLVRQPFGHKVALYAAPPPTASSTPASGVKVAGLEWKKAALLSPFNERLIIRIAVSVVGDFCVEKESDASFALTLNGMPICGGQGYGDIEDALAACNAEYERGILSCLVPASQPAQEAVADDDLLTPEQAWDIHINRDDRNSPEEYPEMALITYEELADFMERARPSTAPSAPVAAGGDEDLTERCICCAIPFKPGDLVLFDVEGGQIHFTCSGPERESYAHLDGTPLDDGDPLPEPHEWQPETTPGMTDIVAGSGSARLDALIAAAMALGPMTAEEIAAQRASWARGEAGLDRKPEEEG